MKKNSIDPELWQTLVFKMEDHITKHHRPATEVIIDDLELQGILKVSRRTTYKYRKSGKLVFHQIGNRIYYFLSSVIDFIKNHIGNYEKQ